MVARPVSPRPKRVQYKTYLALFPSEWSQLRGEAEARGISGAEVIASIISRYLVENRAPLPEDPGEESRSD